MEAVIYKCPNCGGELKFQPDKQDFACDFCLSRFTEEEIKIACAKAENSIPKEAKQEQENFEEHTNLYHCSSCGAEIMCEDNETATFCYYCHEPVILAGKMSGEYKPSKVIGFSRTREQAERQFLDWCKKRKFLPKDFATKDQLEKMTGLYVPFWVTDCDVKADYMGNGKIIRSWTSGKYRYTETKEFLINRKADVFTQGIPADGESKIDDLLMESIEPFDYSQAKPFSMSYLSGFFADKYDVDKAGVFPRIQDRVNAAARRVINDSIGGYTTVVPVRQDYKIMNTNWEYMLLPVWFMTYRYKGQVYSFAVNGQTGKLAGTPPLNKAKLKLVSLISALVAGGIAGLIAGGLI